MKKLLEKGMSSVNSVAEKAISELSSKVTLVKELVNGLPIFVSQEASNNYVDQQFDEKHYFVIPFYLSEYNFALHTMRCLPKSVPEINDLPKKRIFHFANEHAEFQLKSYMQESARELVEENHKAKTNALVSLADSIDSLDRKLTYGMLLVGGAAAIFNPILGAGIAIKAVIPGVSGLLSKYGLRPGGEKISEMKLKKDIRIAEENVAKQFEDAETLRVINPILQELDFALNTTAEQHDPLTDPNLATGSIPELSNDRWRELTEKAICHAYKEAYEDSSLHAKAKLGAEDIRWLKTMFDVVDD